MAGECNYELLLAGVEAMLEGLELKDLATPPADLPIVRRFAYTPDWLRAVGKPCVAYGPGGLLQPMGGTNLRKDTGYPLAIRVLAAADPNAPEQGDQYLRWLDAIRTAFEDHSIEDLDNAYTCTLQPGPIVEPEAAALNVLSMPLFFLVKMREAR